MIDDVYNKVLKLQYLPFLVACVLLSILLMFIPLWVLEHILGFSPPDVDSILEVQDEKAGFVLGVVIGPLIETLVFHVGLMLGLRILLSFILGDSDGKSRRVLLLSSAVCSLVFGVVHAYDSLYILVATYMGLFFCLIYFLSIRKGVHPFFPVFITHSAYNLIVILFDQV